MADQNIYSVTIYAAAPGTPLYEDKKPVYKDGELVTSAPGHMYYTIHDGSKSDPKSYGFAPIIHGEIQSPGDVTKNDLTVYHNPLYARTMEISKAQYEKLEEFGEAPDKFGFDKYYKDVRNNCVDFVWAGLNHAGIQRQGPKLPNGETPGVDGKGSLRPSQNVDDVKGIKAPVPDSPLNTEKTNPMPAMKWWQRPLSENEYQQQQQPFGQKPSLATGPDSVQRPSLATTAASNDPFEQLYQASVSGNDKAFSATAQTYLQSADGQAFLQSGRDQNDQLAAQQKAQEVAAQTHAAPQMTMRM